MLPLKTARPPCRLLPDFPCIAEAVCSKLEAACSRGTDNASPDFRAKGPWPDRRFAFKPTRRRLGAIAKALERDGSYEPKVRSNISAGVVLTREWKGVVHKVTATSGGFQHLGKRYGSLSDIARTITGTRWSGPRFFGLEQKRARSSREATP